MEKNNVNSNDAPPCKSLHLKVRAGFVVQGTTLAAWCREHCINPANARHALIGSWDGPKGRALRTQLLKASGITKSSKAAA